MVALGEDGWEKRVVGAPGSVLTLCARSSLASCKRVVLALVLRAKAGATGAAGAGLRTGAGGTHASGVSSPALDNRSASMKSANVTLASAVGGLSLGPACAARAARYLVVGEAAGER